MMGQTNSRVQRAALLLLDQPPRRALAADIVVQRVFANDETLRRTAQAVLRNHPEWVAEALPVLERLLSGSAPTPDTSQPSS